MFNNSQLSVYSMITVLVVNKLQIVTRALKRLESSQVPMYQVDNPINQYVAMKLALSSSKQA